LGAAEVLLHQIERIELVNSQATVLLLVLLLMSVAIMVVVRSEKRVALWEVIRIAGNHVIVFGWVCAKGLTIHA